MEKIALAHLEMLNQIKLNDAQKDDVLSFFAKREEEQVYLNSIDTSQAVPMVHVNAGTAVLRDDIPTQSFTRQELQAQAPELDAGYWCVPRVIE